jgi:adenosylcobinamide kinase/adenosylcobinamide-phosphate guanylyltransferase
VKNLTLITGAVRSGKSLFAEQLATQSAGPVLYIATMPHLPGDAEQSQRIDRHQRRRPSGWTTMERPYDLPAAIAAAPPETRQCIIDCLPVYISNALLRACDFRDDAQPYEHEGIIFAEVDALLSALSARDSIRFLLVTNEVGWGVVPETSLGRAFRDFVGIANQRLAAQAEEVWLTCVGLPLRLKPQATI